MLTLDLNVKLVSVIETLTKWCQQGLDKWIPIGLVFLKCSFLGGNCHGIKKFGLNYCMVRGPKGWKTVPHIPLLHILFPSQWVYQLLQKSMDFFFFGPPETPRQKTLFKFFLFYCPVSCEMGQCVISCVSLKNEEEIFLVNARER